MKSIRDIGGSFNVYDLFGYLMPGFMFISLFIIEYDVGDLLYYYNNNIHCPGSFENYHLDFEKHLKIDYLMEFISWGSSDEFKFIPFLFLLLLVYLFGHIISAMGSYVLEHLFVRNLRGFPSENLFKKRITSDNFFVKIVHILRDFFGLRKFKKPFNEEFSTELEELIKKRFGDKVKREDYFWLCFTDIAKYNSIGYRRVMHFLNLYSFSRNVAICLFMYIPFRAVLLGELVGSRLNIYNRGILIVYGFLGIIMVWNYLKLFRRQCVEMYYHFYSLHKDDLIKDGGNQYKYVANQS